MKKHSCCVTGAKNFEDQVVYGYGTTSHVGSSPSANIVHVNAHACRNVMSPAGNGRFGLLMRSISRS
jgi:hypothetical protein